MNSSQSNSIGLTPKVQALLQDQLENEKLCVDKYSEYASKAKDPQLSQLLTEIRDCEQKHYDSIQSMLNGTIPNVSSGGGNTGGGSTGMSGSTNSTSMSSGTGGSTNSTGSTGMSSTSSNTGNSISSTSYMNSTSGTSGSSNYSSTTSSKNSSSYTNSSSGSMSTGKTNSKNSYTNSKSSTKDHKNKSHNYNYPPQSTLTASTKDYNEKQPATAQNPVTAANNIFSGYTGGGSMGSYINQADGNSLLRSYENTLHPDDLVIGSGGISYGSYGATDGGPTYDNSASMTSTGGSTGGSYNSQTTNSTTNSTTTNSTTNTTGTTTSNNTGSTNSTSNTSGGMGNSVTSCDQTMCQDLLMTEKHISKNYDTTIFECSNTQMRNVLNHIQKEEQDHGEKLYNYMHQKGWY